MYQKILVPLDGSATSVIGLAEAIKLAKSQKSKLRLLHVVGEFFVAGSIAGDVAYSGNILNGLHEEGRKILKEAEIMVQGEALDYELEMVEGVGGRTADLIVEDAKRWNADLIVLGTHGRRGIRRLVMGSDAEEIIRMSPVPVLLLRPNENS